MTMTEQALADKINCDEWKKDQKGSWISKPGTKIGSYSFSNTTVAPGGLVAGRHRRWHRFE
jgi:hypothetical protein